MRVVLLGPPGAGKGTQAEKLAEKLQIPHLSTGELFRHNISTGTKLGRGDALRLGGITTVADVDALSPPLTITTVAMTASTKTIPAMAAIGRHR